MKAIKFFFALSFALMMTGMNAVNSNAANTIGSGSTNNPQVITYVVNIVQPVDLAGFNCRYWLVITDARGAAVGKPQPFRMGQWSYTFSETGTVQGNRTAKMVADPQLTCKDAYVIPPSTLQGPFGPGRTYTFTLTPQKSAGSISEVH